MKKLLSILLAVSIIIGSCIGAYAQENNSSYLDSANQALNIIDYENLNRISLGNLTETDSIKSSFEIEPAGIESYNEQKSFRQARSTEFLNDPVAIVNSNLSENADFYVVENTSDVYAFLQLSAEDSNLVAILYFVNSDGTLGSSTGFGVYANQGCSAIGLPTGVYAIVIVSIDGSGGAYTLYWNRSNPYAQSGESSVPISISEDLSQVAIYYTDSKILNNGTNVMTDLQYEERRDFIVTGGYAHITTSISSVYETGNIYTGSFSYQDSTPYSTDNALIIELERASYMYVDRYYQNINGDVTSWMYFEDPVTGLTTPRVLGDGPDDADYAPHYLIVDLNTNKVVDFVSVFNYFYLIHGRIPSVSNLVLIN